MTKQKLIEDNMNLVYALISREYPAYLHDEDIIQSGMLGLCKAAKYWDESKATFSGYAWYCIRHAIIHEFKARAKHQGVLSLDYETTTDGVRGSLGETLVGEEDVNYIDLEVKSCRISNRDKQIYELLLAGLSPVEVAKKLGVSRQLVWATRRKLRFLKNGDYNYSYRKNRKEQ